MSWRERLAPGVTVHEELGLLVDLANDWVVGGVGMLDEEHGDPTGVACICGECGREMQWGTKRSEHVCDPVHVSEMDEADARYHGQG